MLARLARFSYRRRRRVLAAWLVALALALTVGASLAGAWANNGRLPGTDAQRATDALQHSFPARAGDDVAVVFPDVVNGRARIDTFLHDVAQVPAVDHVAPLVRAPHGTIGEATVTLSTTDGNATDRAVTQMQSLADGLRAHGVGVEFGSERFSTGSMPASETIGLIAAIIVLLLAFGSVVAMGLPIVTALVGIGIAVAGVGVVANWLQTPDFAPQVATMIGLGVGIDYALFIVTRYRAALERGGTPETAVVEAMTTSGRAVMFAGCTVMISLLGMLVMRLSFLDGLAVGTSLAVAIAVAAALTLLPALLGFVGTNVNRLRIHRRNANPNAGLFARWAGVVQRRPALIATAGLGVLLVAALPVLSMRLGSADASNDPKSATTHKAYDLLAQGFGPGANGPIDVVFDGVRPATQSAVSNVVTALRATPGVVSVSDVTPSPSGNVAIATLTPDHGPQDPKTAALVHHLRDDVVPRALDGSPLHVYLGGNTAGTIDYAHVFASRLPIFIFAVLALSFVLLLVVFRSVLVPLKAVVMNMLSIGAAYGVMVAVFQWGWFANVVGVGRAPIEAWVPMMMFAIVFGLSMDYEVFLLSAVREHYDRTGDNRAAVADGLASTGRLITAAALIMVFVFGSFVVSDVRVLKLIGLGLAVAVAVDATIVRCVLVPATMELLGRANWWLPGWLDRLLPRFAVEEHVPVVAEPGVGKPERAYARAELQSQERRESVEGDGGGDRDVERIDARRDRDARVQVGARERGRR
jgi:RND superfamily putative drug exporter